MMWTTQPRERRRDRRLPLTGHAVFHALGVRRRRDVFGGIVDVSASGVRLRVRPGADVEPGDAVELDLEVPLPAPAAEAPPVRLRGRGRVLRVDLGTEGATEAAMRFELPLELSEEFGLAAHAAR